MCKERIAEPIYVTPPAIEPRAVWPPYPGVLLRRGMQGPSIRQVQERLNRRGANPQLATDGIFGPRTEAAVIAFQRANGLNPDGIVGPITWNALFGGTPVQPPAPPPPPPGNVWPPYPGVLLRRGMQGPSIRQVQERLNQRGANPQLATDGIFGPRTEAAVIAFQRANGLNPDGIVGPLTWNALFAGTGGPQRRFTIVLDPGHGGHDPGAVRGSRRESDDVLRLAQAVRQHLLNRGQNVIMTRDSDVFIPLPERSAISNRNNADLFLSLHRNASVNPAANGVDIFVFPAAGENVVRYARNVLNRVVSVGVQSDRGLRRENLSVLRNTLAPAALLELGFISNELDNILFDQNFDAYARAIADGIMETLV